MYVMYTAPIRTAITDAMRIIVCDDMVATVLDAKVASGDCAQRAADLRSLRSCGVPRTAETLQMAAGPDATGPPRGLTL